MKPPQPEPLPEMSPQQKLEKAQQEQKYWDAKLLAQLRLPPAEGDELTIRKARMAYLEVVRLTEIAHQTKQEALKSHSAQAPPVASPQATPSVASKPKRAGPGFIYILKSGVTIDDKEVIKIGMTTRAVDQRVRELKTGSVGSFEIAYSLRVENARELERQLHARFSASRAFGGGGQEFFHVPAEQVIAEIERMATKISQESSARLLCRRDGCFPCNDRSHTT